MTLLVLCTRTNLNKVFVTPARACILAFIKNTQLPIMHTYDYLSDAFNLGYIVDRPEIVSTHMLIIFI